MKSRLTSTFSLTNRFSCWQTQKGQLEAPAKATTFSASAACAVMTVDIAAAPARNSRRFMVVVFLRHAAGGGSGMLSSTVTVLFVSFFNARFSPGAMRQVSHGPSFTLSAPLSIVSSPSGVVP